MLFPRGSMKKRALFGFTKRQIRSNLSIPRFSQNHCFPEATTVVLGFFFFFSLRPRYSTEQVTRTTRMHTLLRLRTPGPPYPDPHRNTVQGVQPATSTATKFPPVKTRRKPFWSKSRRKLETGVLGFVLFIFFIVITCMQ